MSDLTGPDDQLGSDQPWLALLHSASNWLMAASGATASTWVCLLSRRSRNQTGKSGHASPSAVRAIFGWSADPHPPEFSRSAGANSTNPMGSSHYGASMIASSVLRRHEKFAHDLSRVCS